MKSFVAFLLLLFFHFSFGIPIEESEDYKNSKIEYDALIAKLNATDPCQLSFECNNREECVNFPKCKNGEKCPRTTCVPRKLCKSTICPPGTECAEFGSSLGDWTEHKYNFKPPINYIGDTRGIRPTCVTRKVPSDGNICGENEEILSNRSPLAMSENTCSIQNRYGLVQPLKRPYITYCRCKRDFVRDDANGECIHYKKCPNFKSTQSPPKFESQKNEKVTTQHFRGKRNTINPKKIKNFSIEKNDLTKKPFETTTMKNVTPQKLSTDKKRIIKQYPQDVHRSLGPCLDCIFYAKDNPMDEEFLPELKPFFPAKLPINALLPNQDKNVPIKDGEIKNEEKYLIPKLRHTVFTNKQQKSVTRHPKTFPKEIKIEQQ